MAGRRTKADTATARAADVRAAARSAPVAPAVAGGGSVAEGSSSSPKAEHGQAQVQAKVDAENEQGFRGVKVDPTPNENYTLDGVIAGKPTPETDPGLRAKARDAAGIR